MTKETVPRVRLANKLGVCAFFDITLGALNNWIRRGCPFLTAGDNETEWEFDLLAVAVWRYGNETGEGGDGGEVVKDPNTLPPLERKQWFEGEHKRRDLQLRDRTLIPAQEVEAASALAFATVAESLKSLLDNLDRVAGGLSVEQHESAEGIIYESMRLLQERLSAISEPKE